MKRERKPKNKVLFFKPEKFRAMFYNDYDGKIVLKQADETYLKLLCCTEKDIGADIRDIFEDREYKRIKYYFDSYRGHNFNLKYVEQFSNCKNLLWEVDVHINCPLIKFEGHLIDTDSHCITNIVTDEKSENRDSGLFIVSKKKNGYFVEFCSDNITSIISYNVVGKYIDKEISDNILEPIKLCIDERREVKSCNVFTFPSKKEKIVKMLARPVYRNDCCAAVVEMIFSDLNGNNRKFETETDEFFQKNIIGSGIINCEMHNNMYFTDINPYLAKLIKDGKINKRALINAHPFRSAIHERLSSFGRISFYTDNDEKIDYIMGAIPIIEGGTAIRLYVFIVPTENSDMIDASIFNELTPRESNVLRLAAEGLDNRRISQALNITEGTAKRELFYCYKKLGVKSKIETIRKLYHL